MRHHNSLIHGLLKPMPWGTFDRLVDKHGADKHVRTLSTKSQLVALLHAQFSGASSLRDVEATMESHATRLYHLGVTAPRRSTLADANSRRPAAVFVDVFAALLAQAHPGLRRATKEAVRLIDSTSVSLSNLSNDWAAYEAHGAGAKLHVMYDPNAVTPTHFAITPQRSSDIGAAKAMSIESGTIYVFDLGYYDFAWWAKIAAAGSTFVTRLKTHTKTTIVAERQLPAEVAARGRVRKDLTVRLPGRLKGTRKHPLACDLREVHVVIETGKTLRIVSNDLTSPAEIIADLYKTRWQIELFFRWVKQTLKIRRFLGTTENAVRIQLAVAMIAFLLLRIAHAAQRSVDSPLTFARLVRANLMHNRTIHDLAKPEPPPPPILSHQLGLALQ
jgi:IS4 transposase